MKQSLRSIALASIFALTLAPALVAQTSSQAMGGSAPRPQAMGGSAPRPQAVSASSSTNAIGGSAPRPQVVGAAVSAVLSYLGF